MGPLMLDCASYELSAEEQEILRHPMVGGVILFSRNYHDKQQLRALVEAIRNAAGRSLLIGVDHEGGRVQRFRQGFTTLPAMGQIHRISADKAASAELAQACGHILAYELKQMDIDLSFGPVLDLDRASAVIGDRGFSSDCETVTLLAQSLVSAMHYQGMPATGKHFPGHGSVEPDSHIALPVDDRPLELIQSLDMAPFKALLPLLDAVMPAHVIYTQADTQPAGFSSFWLQDVLRQSLAFDGVVFSDDLSMHGAAVAGNYTERAKAALAAGCDMVLACNNPLGAMHILDNLQQYTTENGRLTALHHRKPGHATHARYQQAKQILSGYADKL
ncbi:beta-N-acetylhexosaminidase [Salinimonas chungwhensis]|uniref:beta-N-acetylhexosaminidase n=1 Tax=Salinimonas chungwhensis TaxID=265425 RepID=UPI00035CDF85|nr:beta-N-acetylhexosaminidase [Salinimonas chungwhensis]